MCISARIFVVATLFWLVSFPATAANEWVTCDPVEVATFSNRIHVQCSSSVAGGIRFFARAITNDADAARYLSTMIAAQVAGRTIKVLTDVADTSGTTFGCLASDCRLLKAVSFGN